MNNSLTIKNCPFCKNQIPVKSEKCPICRMILIERIENAKRRVYSTKLDPPSSKTNTVNNNEAFNDKTSIPPKDYFADFLTFIKRKKGIIAFSCAAIILISFFLKAPSNTNKTFNNYEVEKSKTDNLISANQPTQINESANPKPEDFVNTVEKVIPNGQVFFKNKKFFTGLGKLTIKNGTDKDAVVKLVSTSIEKSVMDIYIRRNSDYTIKQIKDSDYTLYFMVGRYYDEGSLMFLQDCSFAVFDKDFLFATKKYHVKNNIRTESSGFEITLHSVADGNVRTNKITKEEFLIL